MARDLTMILSVLLSLISVGFGVYKSIEVSNTKAFAYEQAYRIVGAIENSNLSSNGKASLIDAALANFSRPPAVLNFSRSSAESSGQSSVCNDAKKALCRSLAQELGQANSAHGQAGQIKASIVAEGCFVCYTP